MTRNEFISFLVHSRVARQLLCINHQIQIDQIFSVNTIDH